MNHENYTLSDKFLLLCTTADLTTIENKVIKQDKIEVCTQERQNTKWQFKLNPNLTTFENVLRECRDSVIPEPLLRNNNVNCLISDRNAKQLHSDNLCLFQERAVHLLHRMTSLETSISNISIDFVEKLGCDQKQFCEVSMESLPTAEGIVEEVKSFI